MFIELISEKTCNKMCMCMSGVVLCLYSIKKVHKLSLEKKKEERRQRNIIARVPYLL